MRKVLVVDDDPDVLVLIKVLMDRHGFYVDFITNTSNLFKKILEFDPGLIILDVHLKDGDGRQVCKELKKNDLTKHLPIILFSADHKVIKEFQECNADGFIGKPIESKTFVEHARKFFKN